MNIKVNNVNLYYEVQGKGNPLILLHGNRENNKIFDKLVDCLKNKYTVYSIDSRCHGKSENTKIISYDLMCDDIICFIKELKIKKPILYGFSDGGIVGLLIAIKEPNLLKKLIVSGPNLYPKGFKLSMLLYCRYGYFKTKNKLFKLMLEKPNIKVEELHKIKIPTVLIVGSNDIVKEKHTKLIVDNINNCKFERVKKATHSSYVVCNKKLYEILKKYL